MSPTEPQMPTPAPEPAPKPKRSLTWRELAGLIAVPVLAIVAGLWVLQWLSTPRFQGDTLEGWRAKLRAPGLETRKQALVAVGKLPSADEKTITALTGLLLEEDDAETRAEASRTLEAILSSGRNDRDGPMTDLRRRTIERLLVVGREDQRPAQRQRACEGLVRLVGLTQPPDPSDEVAKAVYPRVLALLLDRVAVEIDAERKALLEVLAKVPVLPPDAESLLLLAAARETEEGRQAVARCLVAVQPLTAKSVPVLIESLAVPEMTSRIQSHLLRFGPVTAKALLPLLDPDDPRAKAAAETLVLLGPAAVVELKRAVQAGDPVRRERMARLLTRFGIEGFAILLPLLRPEDPESARIAQTAFIQAKANARLYLQTQRQHPDEALRSAIEALLKQLPEVDGERPK